MTDSNGNTHMTIPVSPETKERAEKAKRNGLTWDAFVSDLLDSWEGEE